MDSQRAFLLSRIEARSRRAAAALSRELVQSSGEEKETIMAGIEFEQWLADTCADCRNGR